MGDLEKQETVLKKVEEEEKERFLEGNGKSVVDFDVLCSTVALQTQGKLAAKLQSFHGGEEDGNVGDLGGVFRMWEGEVLDCLDDRRIALESLWSVPLSHSSPFSFIVCFFFHRDSVWLPGKCFPEFFSLGKKF